MYQSMVFKSRQYRFKSDAAGKRAVGAAMRTTRSARKGPSPQSPHGLSHALVGSPFGQFLGVVLWTLTKSSGFLRPARLAWFW